MLINYVKIILTLLKNYGGSKLVNTKIHSIPHSNSFKCSVA